MLTLSQSSSPVRNERESTATPSPSGSPRKPFGKRSQQKYNFNLNSMPLRDNTTLFSQTPPTQPRSVPPEASADSWPRSIRLTALSTIRPEISTLLSRSGALSLSQCALDEQLSPPSGARSAPPNSPVSSDFEDFDPQHLQTNINRFINDFEEILLIQDRSPDFKFNELAACLESIIDADEKAHNKLELKMHGQKAEKFIKVKKRFGNLQAQSVGPKKLSELVLKQYLRSHGRRINGCRQQFQSTKQKASLKSEEEKSDSHFDELDNKQKFRGYGKQKKSTKEWKISRSPY